MELAVSAEEEAEFDSQNTSEDESQSQEEIYDRAEESENYSQGIEQNNEEEFQHFNNNARDDGGSKKGNKLNGNEDEPDAAELQSMMKFAKFLESRGYIKQGEFSQQWDWEHTDDQMN